MVGGEALEMETEAIFTLGSWRNKTGIRSSRRPLKRDVTLLTAARPCI
jgi:hypothetical protein